MGNKIRLLDVKQAMLDPRFQKSLPESILPDLQKFIKNPGCACNAPIYRKILKECPDLLRKYFPTKEYEDPKVEVAEMAKNSWRVINCDTRDLEHQLRMLPPGRKQIAVARYEDKITVVINELDFIYSP